MGGYVPTSSDVAESDLADARSRIRIGQHTGPTSGLAPGFAQANLVILPADYALDFVRFCVRNPKPCPLLEVTDTGSPNPGALSRDADLRTDIPRYRVFVDGALVDEPTDVKRYWRDDLVSFLLGCSFTFEWALSRRRSADWRINARASTFRCTSTDRRLHGRGTIRGSTRGVDETLRARRHRARSRDHLPLSLDARRARPYR